MYHTSHLFLASISNTLVLLNVRFDDAFAAAMAPGTLYAIATVFLILTAVTIVATYSILYTKKKKNLINVQVRSQLEELITELIAFEDLPTIEIPDGMFAWLTHKDARQMVIDELLQNKNNFVGTISEKLRTLYMNFGLNIDSRMKLDDKRGYVQCQGIHELCVMEQKEHYRKVFQLTNSKDADVRIEAQTAILKWYGFKGLRFLNVASYPISDFQQLKLLELLRPLPFAPLTDLNNWLASQNATVVNFALKLAEHYTQVQAKAEVSACLAHGNEAVRIQAVKTLSAIGDGATAVLLTEAYRTEKFTNRLNILKELPKIAGDEQRDFLIGELQEGHEYLKVAAAKVLAECVTDGIEVLESKTIDETARYREIYLHVKSALTR